jgi:hypothetical protein
MAKAFPEGFQDLEQYAPDWVLATPLDRQRKRADSSFATVKSFYDALFPQIDRIFVYLNTVPINGMTQADKNLYNLAATWMEMSHPIDLGWNDTDERHVFPFERVQLDEISPGLP